MAKISANYQFILFSVTHGIFTLTIVHIYCTENLCSGKEKQTQDFYELKQILYPPNIKVMSWSPTNDCAGSTLDGSNPLLMFRLSWVKWTWNSIRMGVKGGEDRHLRGDETVTQSIGSSGTCYGVLAAGPSSLIFCKMSGWVITSCNQ